MGGGWVAGGSKFHEKTTQRKKKKDTKRLREILGPTPFGPPPFGPPPFWPFQAFTGVRCGGVGCGGWCGVAWCGGWGVAGGTKIVQKRNWSKENWPKEELAKRGIGQKRKQLAKRGRSPCNSPTNESRHTPTSCRTGSTNMSVSGCFRYSDLLFFFNVLRIHSFICESFGSVLSDIPCCSKNAFSAGTILQCPGQDSTNEFAILRAV